MPGSESETKVEVPLLIYCRTLQGYSLISPSNPHGQDHMGLIHVKHIVIHHLTDSQGVHLLLSNGRLVSSSHMMLTSGDTNLWFIHSGMRFSGVDMRSIQCVHVLTHSLL